MKLVFPFMDIHTAAKYLSLGYRARRPAWTFVDYIYEFSGRIMGSHSNSCTKGEFSLAMSLQDLLADDWKIITTDIMKVFPIIYSE